MRSPLFAAGRAFPRVVVVFIVGVFFVFCCSFFFSSAEAVTWTDWDGRQSCVASAYLQPHTDVELQAIVQNAMLNGHTQIKVVGAGHSFSPIVLTDSDNSILLNLDKLDKVLSIDPVRLEVRVQAGIRVHVLNDALFDAGFALFNMGAIAQQSIAGATQTGTHGTGKNLGSMSTQIRGFKMLLANATFVDASETSNTDLFFAGRVGLGSLGILTEVLLAITPLFKLRRTAMPYSLAQLLVDLPRLEHQYERMQWYYTPYSDNATLLLREPVPIDSPIVPCWTSSEEKKPFSDLLALKDLAANVTCTDWSFKALTRDGDDTTIYTEIEYFVSVEDTVSLAKDFLAIQDSFKDSVAQDCAAGSLGPCSLFTGFRYAQRDDNWLSPMYQRDIAVISNIVLGNATRTGPFSVFEAYGQALEKVAVAKYRGRPHWGKFNWATSAKLRPAYPRFDAFTTLRAQVDPQGMFDNEYLRKVLG